MLIVCNCAVGGDDLMPRKASSVSEFAQIARVRALLHDIGVAPSPYLQVITASGRKHLGQLVRDVVGNTPKIGGWHAYGQITLSTEGGKVEIDYLDVVTVQRIQQAQPEQQSYILPPRGRGSARVRGRSGTRAKARSHG